MMERPRTAWRVSVLFSEPKIPQLKIAGADTGRFAWFQCSSASRKFLNYYRVRLLENTQSFSALQRAENSSTDWAEEATRRQVGFSALQRAENSSTQRGERRRIRHAMFQCSSASRKFLNIYNKTAESGIRRFSALQRAENSSTGGCCDSWTSRARVSVLFSEPKIPQAWWSSRWLALERVSVLFSEPKIPQFSVGLLIVHCCCPVSVLFSEPKIPQL